MVPASLRVTQHAIHSESERQKRITVLPAMALTMIIASLVSNAYTQTATDAATQAPSSHVRMYKLQLKPGVAYSAPAGAHLTYYGGRVVSNMQVVQVLYGTGSYLPEVQSTTSPSMATFYQEVLNSSYVDWLDSDYNTVNNSFNGVQTKQHIGRGAFLRQITITPSSANSGSTIDDSNIQAELAAQIQAGHLPAPTSDAQGNNNTYYAVFFPHGKTITNGGSSSCANFCAYHGTIANVGGHEVYYGVHPDMQTGSGCENGCGGGATPFNNCTSVASHQMIETITDAEVGVAPATGFGPPLAWYDQTNGEIGDICNAQQGSVTGSDLVTYVVQQEFSNSANDCITSRTVTNPNDFSISASPTSVSVAAGNGTTSTIATAVTSGSAQTVSLSVSGMPSGMTASLNPTSVSSGGSSTLSISTTSSAATGTYTLTVTGTANSGSHSTTVTVTVTNGGGGGSLVNGGFETGDLTGWTASGASETVINAGCHGGAYCAQLGSSSPTSGDSTITQTFTAPGNATTISLWYKIVCPDTVIYDWATVTLTDNTAATSTTLLPPTYTNNGTWTNLTANLTAGDTYTLTMTSHDDNYPGDPTYTLFDDVAVNVPPNDFSLSASPTSTTVSTGSMGTVGISTATTSGSAQSVSLSASGAPSGVSISFNPTSVTSGQGSTMTIAVSGNATVGTYTITVIGTAASGSHTATVALTIALSDFSLSASPATVRVAAGSSGTTTISTSTVSGAAETISFGASGVPNNVTATFNPTSVTSGQSSTLTFAAGSSAPSSTSTITVTGTGSSTSHSAGVALVVIGNGGIVNGGFEMGSLYGWVPNGVAGITGTAHSGSYAAILGSTMPTNGSSTLSQTFTAPSGTTTLSLYYAVGCPANATGVWVMVTLVDNTVGGSRNIVTKTCPTSFVWTQAATGIIAGHSYTLTFMNHAQKNGLYSLYDDVNVQ